MSVHIVECQAFAGVNVSLMGRVEGDNGANVTQAAISSIAYSVGTLTVEDDGEETFAETASGSLTVADVVFDTLQTDARWDRDATGYNFRWTAPGSLRPTAGDTYRFVVTMTQSGGGLIVCKWDVPTV